MRGARAVLGKAPSAGLPDVRAEGRAACQSAPMRQADFDLEPGYLNTASIGVPPRVAVEALQSEIGLWAAGQRQAPDYDEPVQLAREAFARLTRVDSQDVAIGPQLS